MAGERGVTAALLAQTGFQATELGLEGVQGFARMYTDGHLDPAALLDGLGESFIITDRWVKRYPMNTTLHAPVEALLQVMRRARPPTTTTSRRSTPPGRRSSRSSPSSEVSTVVSAQASLPFALAVAAVRGQVGVDEFTDETVADPVVQAMIPRTVVHQDDELYAQGHRTACRAGSRCGPRTAASSPPRSSTRRATPRTR